MKELKKTNFDPHPSHLPHLISLFLSALLALVNFSFFFAGWGGLLS